MIPTILQIALGAGLSTAPAAPALIELFSSEGCSSCPPAESLFSQIDAEDSSVTVLEFHVDYWNHLGWADPFSSADFSERQSHYAAQLRTEQVFTPQAIVNGRRSLVGSDADGMKEALRHREPVTPLDVTFASGTVWIRGEGTRGGELWLAIAEAGLVTDVARGENRGVRLHHGPVVRRLTRLGAVGGAAFARELPIELEPQWNAARLRVVAVIQDPVSGQVLALGRVQLRQSK